MDAESGLVLLPILHFEWNPTTTLAMIVFSLELFVVEPPCQELTDSFLLQAKHQQQVQLKNDADDLAALASNLDGLNV